MTRTRKRPAPAAPFIACTPKVLPGDLLVPAAAEAVRENPANAPLLSALARRFAVPAGGLHPAFIAVLTSKYWRTGGVKLSVSFLDGGGADLQARILQHMNAWGQWANVSFAATAGTGQVRITRTPGQGYWSYLGTDVLSIPANQPTMNLDSFSMSTPESEYRRVVRHETGHTLGCPHEHVRAEIVARIDPAKAIGYFGRTQGWTPDEVRQQVLTPVSEASLMGTPHAEQDSIMCYQLPASITTDGKPVVGGVDITASDGAFMSRVYPKAVAPVSPPVGPPPVVPPAAGGQVVVDLAGKTVTLPAGWAAK